MVLTYGFQIRYTDLWGEVILHRIIILPCKQQPQLIMFIKQIPQGHCVIVTRFGKPVGVRKSGLNFFIPIIDDVANVTELWEGKWQHETNKEGIFIELSEQRTDTEPKRCHTKDNVEITVDCMIRWRITDPIKAVFEVDHLHPTLIDTVLSEVRAAVGSRNLDEVIAQRTGISDKVVQNVMKTTSRWGIVVSGLEIQGLEVDEKTKEAMLKQMEAERVSRAIALEAEGKSKAILMQSTAEKQATITKAQGQAEALRLQAEAERDYVQKIAEVIGAEAAAKVLLTRQTLEGYATISSNPADKVYLPNNVRAIIASVKD